MVIWVKFAHSVHFSSLISKMSTFTLAISCLTTSNLPWFMALTFQIPMQYCSLQHQTLLMSPVTSTTGHCFCFGSIPSFFLELFLHWSPVAYWAPTNLRGVVHLSVSYLFAFSYCSWVSRGIHITNMYWGLPWWSSGKESTCQCRVHGFDPWSGKIPHAMEHLSPCAMTT